MNTTNYQMLKKKKEKIEHKYDSTKLFLETYNYDDWLENEESSDTNKIDLPPMPPLEGGDEEVK